MTVNNSFKVDGIAEEPRIIRETCLASLNPAQHQRMAPKSVAFPPKTEPFSLLA